MGLPMKKMTTMIDTKVTMILLVTLKYQPANGFNFRFLSAYASLRTHHQVSCFSYANGFRLTFLDILGHYVR